MSFQIFYVDNKEVLTCQLLDLSDNLFFYYYL